MAARTTPTIPTAVPAFAAVENRTSSSGGRAMIPGLGVLPPFSDEFECGNGLTSGLGRGRLPPTEKETHLVQSPTAHRKVYRQSRSCAALIILGSGQSDSNSNLLATCELVGGALTTENVLEVPITLLESCAVMTHPPLLQSDIST
jgi:hypothetical protein